LKPVEIVEVGARDGLQNEKVLFSTEQKLGLINKSVETGIRRLEVASFVHPKLVPQMADAEQVVAGLPDNKALTYIGLVLNKRGYMRALATNETQRGIDEVGCVATASDGFGTKNQGQTRQESVSECKDILKLASRDGLKAQVTISVAFGCPFDGPTNLNTVLDMAKELADSNPREIAIADTIGVGVPIRVIEMVEKLKDLLPQMPIRAHFHNTRNTGIANAWAAYSAGAETLDSSVAGLGGCPFAPRATGNIGTEDLLYMLEKSGVPCDVNLNSTIDLANWIEGIMGKPNQSMVSHAGGFPA